MNTTEYLNNERRMFKEDHAAIVAFQKIPDDEAHTTERIEFVEKWALDHPRLTNAEMFKKVVIEHFGNSLYQDLESVLKSGMKSGERGCREFSEWYYEYYDKSKKTF